MIFINLCKINFTTYTYINWKGWRYEHFTLRKIGIYGNLKLLRIQSLIDRVPLNPGEGKFLNYYCSFG